MNREFFQKWWKIIVAGALVLVIGAAAATAAFVALNAPERKLGRALAGLRTELETRIDGSPYRVVGSLLESLKNGQITVAVDHTDAALVKSHGEIVLHADAQEGAYALTAAGTMAGSAVDAQIYVNRERIALGSSLLGGEYYGLRYDTAREEITAFGELLGIDRTLVDETIDTFENTFGTDAYPKLDYSRYTALLENLMAGIKPVKKTVQWRERQCTAIDYVVTTEKLSAFREDYLVLIEEDLGVLRAWFELNGQHETAAQMEETFANIGETIEEEITVTFLIDKSGRLTCISVQLSEGAASEQVALILDLGQAIDDAWTLSVDDGTDRDYNPRLLSWRYTRIGDECNNTLQFFSVDWKPWEPLSFNTTFSHADGSFTMGYQHAADNAQIGGMLSVGDGTFRMRFNEIVLPDGARVAFAISVEKGAQVDDPPFISIGSLDQMTLMQIILGASAVLS